MNLNITVLRIKAESEMAGNPLSWNRSQVFLPMPAAFPVMDRYSVRSYSIKRCFTLHRFLFKSLETHNYLLMSASIYILPIECGPQCLREPVYHAHLFTRSFNGLSGRRCRSAVGQKARWNCIESHCCKSHCSSKKAKQQQKLNFTMSGWRTESGLKAVDEKAD